MNPQPSWDELSVYYSSNYSPYEPMHGSDADDAASAAQARSAGKLRHILLPTGLRVLDVGCGGGYFLRVARLLGADVEGIEPSPHGVEQARKSGLQVFNGTVQDYEQSAGANRFDVITANHVVEHMPNPVEALVAMRNLLKPGGYIWIAVPNAGYPLAVKLRGRWHSSDLPYHLMQFTAHSLATAGERARLKLRLLTTESLPQPTAASIRLYLRYRWGLPRRITERVNWIERIWAPKLARKMDSKCSGEALITELIPA
jgi:2-polyprenyl-3-methyl-5-hydroxy-6-metoxy-1,4-benzoquinol methylase